MFDQHGQLKFHIHNAIDDGPKQTARLDYLWQSGLLEPGASRLAGLASLHRRRAIAMRRASREGW